MKVQPSSSKPLDRHKSNPNIRQLQDDESDQENNSLSFEEAQLRTNYIALHKLTNMLHALDSSEARVDPELFLKIKNLREAKQKEIQSILKRKEQLDGK